MSKLVQTQHFKFKKPYTVESVLKSHEFHMFRAKMAADANGISEEISISVPIMKSDANFEILFMETYPKIKKAKNLLSWTWPITFSKMSLCLADNLAESFDAIVDQNFPNQNQKTGANFIKALSLLTSKAINCPNPRDDVVELLETGVKKSNDLSPSDMWERMGELQTLASRLQGTVQSPDDATLKTLFIRAMPTDLRNSLALQGLDASSSLDDIKKHLDTADAIYQQKHKGSSSNRTSSSNNNSQSNNSHERDGNRRGRSRSRSRSNNRRGGDRGGRGQGSFAQFNTRDHEAPCPLHRGTHTWGQCFDNRYGSNYRGSGGRGGRGGRGDGRGGRGGRGGDNSSHRGGGSYQGQGRDSHHIDTNSRAASGNGNNGPANGAASASNNPPAYVAAGQGETHAIEFEGWGRRNERNRSDASTNLSLFSS